MSRVLIISGSTASGKTGFSLELAKLLNAEIVNFDSLLFYRGMDIGTAKPTNKELEQVKHHLINIESPANPINAHNYSLKAKAIVDSLLIEKKPVILVGGSGFYLRALLYGMFESPTSSNQIVEKSNKLYESDGISPFLEILKENDSESFKRYHENDHYRIRRAVEHFWTNGTPLSTARSKQDQHNQKLNEEKKDNIHGWNLIHYNLLIPKDQHWEIMKDRTNSLLKMGLIDECKSLLKAGFTGDEKPLNSIGYKESFQFLKGALPQEELEERIYLNTRRLAKSQKTWFKKDSFAQVINPLNSLEKSQAIEEILSFFRKV